MNPRSALLWLLSLAFLSSTPNLPPKVREQVWHHRNLGKAYYENPMTQIVVHTLPPLSLGIPPILEPINQYSDVVHFNTC